MFFKEKIRSVCSRAMTMFMVLLALEDRIAFFKK